MHEIDELLELMQAGAVYGRRVFIHQTELLIWQGILKDSMEALRVIQQNNCNECNKKSVKIYEFLYDTYNELLFLIKQKNGQKACQVAEYKLVPVLNLLKEMLHSVKVDSNALWKEANAALTKREFNVALGALYCLLLAGDCEAEVFYLLAYVYWQLEEYEKTVLYAEKAIKGQSKYDAEAYRLLGLGQRARFRYRLAIRALEKSNAIVCGELKLGEKSDFIGQNALILGQMYLTVGEIAQAMTAYHLASQIFSEEKARRDAFSSYLVCSHYRENLSREELLREHKRYAAYFSNVQQYAHHCKSQRRKIRIGYISPDFRRHVMFQFYFPLLVDYNRNLFEVICYSLGNEDSFTETLKEKVDLWRNVNGMCADKCAAIIYKDEVDILFDLAGHSADTGLAVLAYKPAPIQISGLGYFDTTGLGSVDYFLTDHYVDTNVDKRYFVEKLLWMPQSHFCYCKREDAPNVTEAPYKKNNFITFGCFNKYAKITDVCITVWSKILSQVPESRLILKSMIYLDPSIVAEAQTRMIQAGIDIKRVEFRPANESYMKEYLDIDIALDTFPYPGGGTTCDALYMGVPTIVMEGKRHGARFGKGILHNVGVPELVAKDASEYIEKAVILSRDTELIDLLHKNLRVMMEKSPLMDRALYMKDIEDLYQRIIEMRLLGKEKE